MKKFKFKLKKFYNKHKQPLEELMRYTLLVVYTSVLFFLTVKACLMYL